MKMNWRVFWDMRWVTLQQRQQALELSQIFMEILGLKSVSDTDDLFTLYNQLTDTMRLKKRHSESSGNDDKGQSIADQIGVQAVARAGYSPFKLSPMPWIDSWPLKARPETG